MKHVGRLIAVPAGGRIDVTTTRDPDAPYSAGPNVVSMELCDACGHWWRMGGRPVDPGICNPQCVHCGEVSDTHAGDRCLFAPTRFEMVRFVVSRDGVTF